MRKGNRESREKKASCPARPKQSSSNILRPTRLSALRLKTLLRSEMNPFKVAVSLVHRHPTPYTQPHVRKQIMEEEGKVTLHAGSDHTVSPFRNPPLRRPADLHLTSLLLVWSVPAVCGNRNETVICPSPPAMGVVTGF